MHFYHIAVSYLLT